MHPILMMLTVPPVPPPPPDRLEAATELLRAAPVPLPLLSQLTGTAVYSVSYTLSRGPHADAVLPTVRQLVAGHVAADRWAATAFGRCMNEEIGWTYDLAALKAVREVVRTPGGQVLWQASLSGPVATCLGRTIPLSLQMSGYADALRWLARVSPAAALPRSVEGQDPARWSAELMRFCGPGARDALIVQDGRVGVRSAWSTRRRNQDAFACLVQTARLGDYDLTIVYPDGTTAKVIMGS